MNRNNRSNRGRKRQFNSKNSKQRSNTEKPYLTELQEQLTEEDVGISEYLSKHDPVHGVLKARFSDFHVNEIMSKGSPPLELTMSEVPECFKISTINLDDIPKETPLDLIPQDIWEGISDIINNAKPEKVVELEITTLDKEQRSKIHKTVKGYYKFKIISTTVEKENKKFIQFKKYEKDQARYDWPTGGDYLHFVLYKENIDTLEAVMIISDRVKMKSSGFNYAGVKDRRAKTVQLMSVKRLDPWKLLRAIRCERSIRIGNFCLSNKPLRLGDLYGNYFRIALRNVTADDELIDKSLEHLRENGFINYYGLQRFGNDKEVPTYEIGLKLLLGKFKEVCDLILKCKKADNPVADITLAKQKYNDTQNAEAAFKLIENKKSSVESKLLEGLSKAGKNNYVNALESIPRNMRLLYIHSFQALIWNKVVSKRIKEFGLKPIAGDLILIDDTKDETIEKEETAEKEETVEKEENEELEESSNNQGKEVEDIVMLIDEIEQEQSEKKNKTVKILTEEDIENYKFDDIVLPLPGYDVTYPENIVKDWYKELLESYGLSLEMPKQSVKTYTLSGSYRKLFSRVEDLKWNTMRYNDPNDILIQSDLEKNILKKPEPKDVPDGKYKALVLEFGLKSSCYATMVMREILKSDTSAMMQLKLNNYHQTEVKTSSDDNGLLSGSLLNDSKQYEEFKKCIFGGESNNSNADDDDDRTPTKKLKMDT